jgi:hypothetical protein
MSSGSKQRDKAKAKVAFRRPRKEITPEIALLRATMQAKGVSAEQLAEGTAMTVQTVRNIIADVPRRRGRQLVEDFLQTPIWSATDEFNARQSK